MFGIVLFGFVWFVFYVVFNGDFMVFVVCLVGYVYWLIGVLMVVWLIGIGSGFVFVVVGWVLLVVVGVVLIVLGFGGVWFVLVVCWCEKV